MNRTEIFSFEELDNRTVPAKFSPNFQELITGIMQMFGLLGCVKFILIIWHWPDVCVVSLQPKVWSSKIHHANETANVLTFCRKYEYVVAHVKWYNIVQNAIRSNKLIARGHTANVHGSVNNFNLHLLTLRNLLEFDWNSIEIRLKFEWLN